jgi:hypothetical protein
MFDPVKYHREYNKKNCKRLRRQQKIYWQKNRVRLLKKKLEYRLKNAEKIRAGHKIWRSKNMAKLKAWRKKNRPAHLRYKKNYRKQWANRISLYQKAYREKHATRLRQYRKRYFKRIRGVALKYKYGISFKEYSEMIKNQNKECAICHVKFKKLKQACVDHDHVSNKVRGILCARCNFSLGKFETVALLQSAIKYLKRYAKH